MINENAVAKETILALKNYLIIRLVSFIEYECKNLTKEAIDNYDFDIAGLLTNDEVILSISHIKEIKENATITMGTLISNNINFQDCDKINNTFSQLFKCKKFRDRIDELQSKASGSLNGVKIEFKWDNFHKLLSKRHKTIHAIENNDISFSKLMSIYLTAITFVVFSWIIFQTVIVDQNKKFKINRV